MSTDHDLKPILAKVADGEKLTESMAEGAFNVLMSGQATPSQMGAFLMGLRLRGETIDEITGAARVMREKATGIIAVVCAIAVGDGAQTWIREYRRRWEVDPDPGRADLCIRSFAM